MLCSRRVAFHCLPWIHPRWMGTIAAVVYASHSVGSSEMIWIRPVSIRQILDGDASERVLRALAQDTSKSERRPSLGREI